jgi:hypothetical protein
MRKAYMSIGIAALAMLGVTATSNVSFAQAGSTGGTLGKTEKSPSGDNRAPSQPKTKSSNRTTTAPAVPAIPNGPQTFQNPMSHGMRTDLCQTAVATGCGEPSANMWCQHKGYTRAVSYNWTLGAPAWRQGEGTVCNGPCGILTEVTCK